jgi:hypothetical protein
VKTPALTGPGRLSALPAGWYSVPPPVREDEAGPEVAFTGDDGRGRAFHSGELALPGWRDPVATAFAARVGASGGLRTLASAEGAWQTTRRFIHFLSVSQPSPAAPGELTAAHLDGFHADRARTVTKPGALADLRRVLHLLGQQPLKGLLATDVLDYLGRRWPDPRKDGVPGYSDGELARILAAARSDAVAICDRVEAGEKLADSYRSVPGTMTAAEQLRARELAEITETGIVPHPEGVLTEVLRWRSELARRLFLTIQDVVPLLVLAVTLTGRNVETVKELPARHRLLDGKAVEVTTVKRRRGGRALARPGDLGDRPAQPAAAHARRDLPAARPPDRFQPGVQRVGEHLVGLAQRQPRRGHRHRRALGPVRGQAEDPAAAS